MTGNIIYFDNNATTKVDDEVVKAMLPYFTENYGNAASHLHPYGWVAKAAVEKATEQIAALIGCESSEIVFTSGATEAVNLAIKGIYETYSSKGNHIITCKTEHKAVLDTCAYLESKGARVTYLNVDREGIIDLDELKSAIDKTTILVSIMAANNETGVIQPLEEIADICRSNQVIFFSDGTQYAGKMMCEVKELGINCMAISAHKMHGPKGIGALYISRKDPRVNITEQIHGGGHQAQKRSGTMAVPLIVGFGEAAAIATRDYWENSTHISKIKNFLEHQLLDIEGLRINGSTRNRLYNTSNILFPSNYNIKSMISKFAFSAGSACTSANQDPSHVLMAMGMNVEEARSSYRFSFSKYNTSDEILELLQKIKSLV